MWLHRIPVRSASSEISLTRCSSPRPAMGSALRNSSGIRCRGISSSPTSARAAIRWRRGTAISSNLWKDSDMQLMRIGEPGAEKPVVRADHDSYIDVSDAVGDYDAAFFAGDGIAQLRELVANRADQSHRFNGERIGAPI